MIAGIGIPSFSSCASAIAVRSSSHEVMTLPRRQTSATSARSKREAVLRRDALGVGVAQNVETLGIGLHQAVFDAVVDHLDEVSGAAGPGVHVALLDAADRALAPGRRRESIALAGRQRGKNRVEPFDARRRRRRSSCNSRAPAPRRRRWCRRRDSACPSGAAPCRAGCRRARRCCRRR